MSAAGEEQDVLFERRGALGLITLNRPKALNALTHAMCVAMRDRLSHWKADEAIKTVAIRGAGERAFCAGGDIRALYESGSAGTSYAIDFYRDEYGLNAAVKHFPKPYVALLHGIVMGGGGWAFRCMAVTASPTLVPSSRCPKPESASFRMSVAASSCPAFRARPARIWH